MSWDEIKLALNSTALTKDMKPLDVLLLEKLQSMDAKLDAIRNKSAMVGDDLNGRKIQIRSIGTPTENIFVFDTSEGNSIVFDSYNGYYQGNGIFTDIYDTTDFVSDIAFNGSEKITVINTEYIEVVYLD